MKQAFTARKPIKVNETMRMTNKTHDEQPKYDHSQIRSHPQFQHRLFGRCADGRRDVGAELGYRNRQPSSGLNAADRSLAHTVMRFRNAVLIAAGSLALSGCGVAANAAEKTVEAPVAAVQASEDDGLQVAIFAGGCFWGVEGVFSHVKGVKSSVSGYHGGREGTATYRQIVTGLTNHAEAVRVVYDPKVVRYDELLQIMFSVVTDPTLLNRQGPDVGAHYRSAIVPMNQDQARVARAYLKQLDDSNVWGAPVVTKIENYKKFYEAEEYHQDFMAKNPRHGYIVRWDAPKVRALREMYPEHFTSTFLRESS